MKLILAARMADWKTQLGLEPGGGVESPLLQMSSRGRIPGFQSGDASSILVICTNEGQVRANG